MKNCNCLEIVGWLNILFDISRLDGYVIIRKDERKYICDIILGYIKV